ncbi:MAG: hypothetical protein ACLQVI_23265 [Polyangiaceae bacterium]
MKRLVLSCTLALAALATSSAFAQEPTLVYPPSSPLAPNPQLPPQPLLTLGEPTGTPPLSPWVASTPMRLSLQSAIFPLSMSGMFPNCAQNEDPSGNSLQGFPVQRYTFLQLTPNLTLHGFSSAGCPVDSAIGGGITYSVQIKPSIWLVAGAGVYSVPSHAGLPGRTRSDFGIDLMKATHDGQSVSVGIGRRGIRIGGSF